MTVSLSKSATAPIAAALLDEPAARSYSSDEAFDFRCSFAGEVAFLLCECFCSPDDALSEEHAVDLAEAFSAELTNCGYGCHDVWWANCGDIITALVAASQEACQRLDYERSDRCFAFIAQLAPHGRIIG